LICQAAFYNNPIMLRCTQLVFKNRHLASYLDLGGVTLTYTKHVPSVENDDWLVFNTNFSSISANKDGQQFHQNQENEQFPLISNSEHKKDHEICKSKFRSCLRQAQK